MSGEGGDASDGGNRGEPVDPNYKSRSSYKKKKKKLLKKLAK